MSLPKIRASWKRHRGLVGRDIERHVEGHLVRVSGSQIDVLLAALDTDVDVAVAEAGRAGQAVPVSRRHAAAVKEALVAAHRLERDT